MKRLLLILLLLPVLLEAQIITTVAGTGTSGYSGDGGPAIHAHIDHPCNIIFDTHGNLYICQGYASNRVRKIDATTGIINTVAGTGIPGYNGDGGLADTSELNVPASIYTDPVGNFYIGDASNFRIRKVVASTNIISTYAGNGIRGVLGNGGPANTARISNGAIAIDGLGNMYIGDSGMVRKVDTSGIITLFAGTGIVGNSGDGGPAILATVEGAYYMHTDVAGNVYITSNETIRKINVSTGIITKIAGTVSVASPYLGDGIPATSAHIRPMEVAVDDTGNVYTADELNSRIEKIDTFGIIHTIAGTGVNGFSGDGHSADSAQVNYPEGLAFDPCGNLYIADFQNNRIREITIHPLPATPVPTINISATFDTVCAGMAVTFNSVVAGSSLISSYQWYVNGHSVTTATSSSYSYIPFNGDSVRCVFYTRNMCTIPANDSSNTIHIVVDSPCVSLHTATLLHSVITIFPNPATTELTISAPDNITSLTITNLLGQTVYTNHYNYQKVEVDVSGLPAGVYFVKVNGSEVRKFVKQ